VASFGSVPPSWALVLAVGVVCACTPMNRTPPVGTGPPTARGVSADAPTARAQVERALRQAGFTVRRDADGALTLTGENPAADVAWADCPLAPVHDPDPDRNRRGFARPIGRRAVVVARFLPLGGRTTASLDLLQAGVYQNPYVGVSFEARCRSTGALEALLLDAADSPPAAVREHAPDPPPPPRPGREAID